jgi:hypothetical protein
LKRFGKETNCVVEDEMVEIFFDVWVGCSVAFDRNLQLNVERLPHMT